MALAIVQSGYSAHTPTTSHQVVMGSAPISGNLLIAFYTSFSGTINNSKINTGKWTIQQGHVTGASDAIYMLTRIADGTETTTLPNFQDGSVSTYFSGIVYEVSGGTLDQTAIYTASGGTLNTTAANALAISASSDDGAGSTGYASPWTQDNHASNVSGSGYAICSGHQTIVSSGGSATTSSSNPANGGANHHGIALVNSASTDGTGSGTIGTVALSGVAGTGSTAITASGSIPTVALTTPSGGAHVDATGSGSIGTVTLSAPTTQKTLDTQFGLNVAAIGSVDARATQFGLETVAAPSTIERVTQMGLLVLAQGGEAPLVPDPLSLHDYGRDQVLYQRMVNMYVEATPQGPGKSARYQRPGLYTAATRGGGPIRASFLWNGFRITVSGSAVYRDGVNIGTISPNGLARFAFSDEEIVIVANGTAYYVTETNVAPLAASALAGLNIIDVVFLAERFVYLVGGNAVGQSSQFFWSELNDAQNVDGLSFATVAEGKADALVGAGVVLDQIVFFTTNSIEWWYAADDPDAPFYRSPGRKNERGLAAQGTIALLDNAIFFVGENRIVYRTSAVPQRVSDHSIEDKLRRVKDTDLPNCTAFGVTYGGHTFYVLHLPGEGTWALDIGERSIYANVVGAGLWAEWKSWNRDFFRVNCCDSKGVMGDKYSGALFGFDGKTFTDNSGSDVDPIERVVSTYLPVKTGYATNFNLALDCTRGVGLASGYGSEPVVEARWSDHEGRLWTDWQPASLGTQGDASDAAKAIWYQLGAVRSPGRLFEFRCTDPVFFAPWQVRFNEPRP